MKKIKSLKTLTTLGTIAAITPIIATSCSNNEEDITRKDIGQFSWTAYGEYSSLMDGSDVKKEFIKNNPAGQHGLPADIYENVNIKVVKKSESTWEVNINVNNNNNKYYGTTSAIITFKIDIDAYDWNFNGNYTTTMTNSDIVNEFKNNNKTISQGGTLPNDIYNEGNVLVSAIKTSDGYDIKLTIQSIKQYIGQVQKGIALYGTFTYDNQIFEIPYKNFNINSFCGKGTLTIPTNNGKLDIEDHKSITSLSFPICAPKTYLDDNFLFGCTNLFTLELAKPLDSVLYVGDNFMENCTNLLSLDITALTNVKEIGNNFLYSCSNLGYLDLTSFTNVEEIGNNFLSTCTNLKALRLPEYSNKTLALATSLKTNVASKEWWKTTNKGLFIVPSGQKDNWANALGYTSEEANKFILVPDSESSYITYDNKIYVLPEEIDPNVFCADASSTLYIPTKTGVPLIISAADRGKIIGLYIRSFGNIDFIGDNFLLNFTNLTSLVLPKTSNIKTIENSFLWSCASLQTIDLSCFSQVTTIGQYFINHCDKLMCLNLNPLSNVVDIAANFVTNCPNLTFVLLNNWTRTQTIGDYFLYSSKALTSIDLSNLTSLTTIRHSFLGYCDTLKSIDLSSCVNLDTIGRNFMYCCKSLMNINFNNLTNVTTIGMYFLNHCEALTIIDLSQMTSLYSAENDFITTCDNLKTLVAPFKDPSDGSLNISEVNFLYGNTKLVEIYAGDYAKQYKETDPWNTKKNIIYSGYPK